MPKPVGGRGKKAPYQTTHLRVPVPLKPALEALIEAYRGESSDTVEILTDVPIALDEAKLIAAKLLRSKGAKVEVIAKLLTAIYKTEVTREDLL